MNATTHTIDQLKERLNLDINDIDAAISLGNIYFDNGDVAHSILYYQRALAINPDMLGVRTDLGTMYLNNGDIGLAEQAFREVIARDPGFGNAYVNLGILLYQAKGNLSEAHTVWQQLLDINPNHDAAAKARELMQSTATLMN
jgi:tetratricopeptide (TPR) repeat protein